MIKSEVSDPHSRRSNVYAWALIAVHTMLFLSVWWNTWAAAAAVMSNKNAQVTATINTVVNNDGNSSQNHNFSATTKLVRAVLVTAATATLLVTTSCTLRSP